MVAVVGGSKVFVAHRATGVRLIPEEWLDAWRPSGFREATPTEVLGWYAEREMDPPAEVLRAASGMAPGEGDAGDAGDEERRREPITLRAESLPETSSAPIGTPPLAHTGDRPTLRALL